MDFAKVFNEAMPLLLEGVKLTIGISLLAIAVGMVIGFLSCIMGLSKNPVLKAISAVYVWLIRGTPMIVQAFFVFYAVPQLIKLITGSQFTLSPFAAGSITLSLNAGAYLSEIFRGGIQSIPVGQHEASQVLGMTRGQTFFHIVLPQVMKRVLLTVSNEVITLVKDTSLANVIAVAELFRAAKNEASRTASVEPLFVAGLFYLLMNGMVSLVFSYLNRRMAYYKD